MTAISVTHHMKFILWLYSPVRTFVLTTYSTECAIIVFTNKKIFNLVFTVWVSDVLTVTVLVSMNWKPLLPLGTTYGDSDYLIVHFAYIVSIMVEPASLLGCPPSNLHLDTVFLFSSHELLSVRYTLQPPYCLSGDETGIGIHYQWALLEILLASSIENKVSIPPIQLTVWLYPWSNRYCLVSAKTVNLRPEFADTWHAESSYRNSCNLNVDWLFELQIS